MASSGGSPGLRMGVANALVELSGHGCPCSIRSNNQANHSNARGPSNLKSAGSQLSGPAPVDEAAYAVAASSGP